MPTSSYKLISSVLFKVLELEPHTVLDVGVGCGKYGALLREYIDVYQHGSLDRYAVIDGVEVFRGYAGQANYYHYDKVVYEDIRHYVIPHGYDVILLCDVLEHMSKSEAFKVLNKCIKRAKRVIVTTPVGKTPQKAVNGNKYERHMCGFVPKDFAKYTDKAVVFGDVFMVVVDGKK